jgi:hypothetical protein
VVIGVDPSLRVAVPPLCASRLIIPSARSTEALPVVLSLPKAIAIRNNHGLGILGIPDSEYPRSGPTWLTTGVSAEYGRSSGGKMQMVYKSGTNSLHGSFDDSYLPGSWTHRAYLTQFPTPPNAPWY